MANDQLHAAKSAKNDEFYTQYEDIEQEMNAYIEYNKKVFSGKTILCPCDDPEWSNFTRYFAARFEKLELKKLICTSYAKSAGNKHISSYELNSPKYDEEKHHTHGKIFVLEKDINHSGKIDHEDIEFEYLEGDGDFRSEEVTKLRDEADIIITNPPFSLFRTFLKWIVEGEKEFIIIGSKNAITYKEVFPLIKDNKIWLGPGFKAGNAFFEIPIGNDHYVSGVYDEKTNLVKFRNCGWFTNIDHEGRHDPLQLMTMEDNLKYNKKLKKKLETIYGKLEYPHYDNYDAIEVPFTEAIPSDYKPCWFSCPYADKCDYAQNEGLNDSNALCENACSGDMGVPITFLDKYNPEQFDIVKFRKGNDEKDLTYTTSRDTLERNGTERNGTKNYALLQDYYPSQDVTDSWESQSHSLINSVRNNLKSFGLTESIQHAGMDKVLPYQGKSCIEELSSARKCNGVMGVPITFMDKFSPEQFVIIGMGEDNGSGHSGGVWQGGSKSCLVFGKAMFKRIFIRRNDK